MKLKAREICRREAPNIPYVMVISYILEKGQDAISMITDEDILKLKGNALMTDEFVKTLVTVARAVVRECDQNDIVRLIKAEWCCGGEVYDPDLDQFVTDVENDTEDDYDE